MNIKPSSNIEPPQINVRLFIALGLVVLFHGVLLPYTVGNTYDAYIHMFFGDHYARSWFDPWEPRWYTGFTTTSYPPGTHMGIAVFSKFFSLITSFNLVMLIGLCTFVLGTYRFSLLFVSNRAAGYAAIAVVFSSSIVETVHLFGQLPTIFSLGLFLNGMPHVFRWLVRGQISQLLMAIVFACATTAAHHVTTLFGTLLFIGPVGLYAWIAYLDIDTRWTNKELALRLRLFYFARPLLLGVVLGVLLVAAIIITVFPYWFWSITDPITQVSIPHGSRESFLERLDLGFVFFIIPWGMMICVLPYVVIKAMTSRLWPLSLSILVCFILGTGGTTPLPRLILGPAFDILTLDRFTFWATVLILPFAGMLIESLLHNRLGGVLRAAFGERMYKTGIILAGVLVLVQAVSVGTLSTFRPSQPTKIDPNPIIKFMNEDQHDRWRYLTLGFGDQFAYISARINARSVDGNYHSVRRLPELVSYAVERLENSKYLGVPGLGSLQQFLVNTDKYHLKFVFSNDAFYDPLLHFSGWNRLRRLPNGIVVWEKPDTAPLPSVERKRSFPTSHKMMWGLLPPLALILGYGLLLLTIMRRGAGHVPREYRPITFGKAAVNDVLKARRIAKFLAVVFLLGAGFLSFVLYQTLHRTQKPEEVLADYHHYLDFRYFDAAFELLEPLKGLDFETFLLWRRWEGGLLASYAKLTDLKTTRLTQSKNSIDFKVDSQFITPFGVIDKSDTMRAVFKQGEWKITSKGVVGYAPPQRIQSEPAVVWSRSGKRQPKLANSHSDIMDRPIVAVLDGRLIKKQGRYHLIGLVRNEDVDPAAIKYTGKLKSESGEDLSLQQAGPGSAHRLLPGEIGTFDIQFEGTLSLQDEVEGNFDPNLYIPPVLSSTPQKASIAVAGTVNENNLYRSLSWTAIEPINKEGKWHVSAQLTNTGTQQSELIQVQYALFDDQGRIIDTGFQFLDRDLKPGITRSIEVALPQALQTTVINNVVEDDVRTNGVVSNAFDQRMMGEYLPGLIPLPKATGYSGVMLFFRTMNFAPLY